MGDEVRLAVAGGTARDWLAAADRAVEGLGLRVIERGDGWLAAVHPDADADAGRRWGGHVVVEADAAGLFLVFHLGLRRREITTRVEEELRRAGLSVQAVSDDP